MKKKLTIYLILAFNFSLYSQDQLVLKNYTYGFDYYFLCGEHPQDITDVFCNLANTLGSDLIQGKRTIAEKTIRIIDEDCDVTINEKAEIYAGQSITFDHQAGNDPFVIEGELVAEVKPCDDMVKASVQFDGVGDIELEANWDIKNALTNLPFLLRWVVQGNRHESDACNSVCRHRDEWVFIGPNQVKNINHDGHFEPRVVDRLCCDNYNVQVEDLYAIASTDPFIIKGWSRLVNPTEHTYYIQLNNGEDLTVAPWSIANTSVVGLTITNTQILNN